MIDFRDGYFVLHTESDGELTSYSAGSRGGRHILKLEVQYSSATNLGYAVDELARLQGSIKAIRAATATRAKSKRKPLALPPPEGQA